MIKINRNPNHRDLLIFGILLGAFTILTGSLAYFRGESVAVACTIWLVGAGLTVIYFVIPPLRRFIYLGWMYAAFPIGWTVSHVILAVVYYAVVTPIGLAMRVLGRDPLARRFENRQTYWEAYDPQGDSKRYFRQF